jgi:glycosyltransferase involved in cell wall biosynthesis
MAAGVPVIASSVCGVPYQVEEGRTGFMFETGDVERLAERLDTLLGDAGLRSRFGGAAAAKARTSYRADAVARQTIEVYRDVVNDAGRGER